MMSGVNVNAGGELGTIELYSRLFTIPSASVSIGGASYDSLVGPMPLSGIVVAGLVSPTLACSGPAAARCPRVEITIAPAALFAQPHIAGADLKAAYQELRRQMVFEGVPFLDAAELEREIADRKGTRS